MALATRIVHYTKTVRSVWLDNLANTYLPLEPDDDCADSMIDLIPATTQGGKQVAEYLAWLRENGEYTVTGTEYTRVYITEQQMTYILMRWNGIRYATDKWKTV